MQQTSWQDLIILYNKYNIKTVFNYPIDDIENKEIEKEIFAAAQYLFDMCNNKNLKVFVNCRSGITRATTVVLTYLVLYKRVQNWNKIEYVD